MGVIIPGDFKVVHIKRYFTLNVFVLTRFHCTYHYDEVIFKLIDSHYVNMQVNQGPIVKCARRVQVNMDTSNILGARYV